MSRILAPETNVLRNANFDKWDEFMKANMTVESMTRMSQESLAKYYEVLDARYKQCQMGLARERETHHIKVSSLISESRDRCYQIQSDAAQRIEAWGIEVSKYQALIEKERINVMWYVEEENKKTLPSAMPRLTGITMLGLINGIRHQQL